MWKKIILVATVSLVSAATPGLAVAATPSPDPATAVPLQAPARIGPEQDCGQVLRQALATGQDGKVMCVSRVSSPTVKAPSTAPDTAAPDTAAPDATAPNATAPDASATDASTTEEPAACNSGSWGFGRHGACITNDPWVLSAIAIVEGQPRVIGQIFYTVSSRTVTAGHSLQWEHILDLDFTYAWGSVSGISVNANAECGAANCSLYNFYFNFGLALAGTSRGGRSVFTTTSLGFGSYWHTASAWRWWFTAGAVISNQHVLTAPAQRCDEAVGIAGSVGCVYTQRRPVHEIGRSRWPKYARHIELAINFGLPRVLTRTMDEAQKNANRERACPSSQTPANGWSCDEYPYASTHEGAANPMHPYGRTFQILNWNSGYPPFVCGIGWLTPRRTGESLGYSACGIPLQENRDAGVDLGVWYITYRVIHNDQFEVKIVA